MQIGHDASWSQGKGPIPFQIAVATFGILALELALIRWVAGQVRVFAYFNNLILISAFLGMGLGVALGRRRPGLVHWTLPALLIFSAAMALSEPLGLAQIKFPDRAVHIWGAESGEFDLIQFGLNLVAFMAVVVAVVSIFLFAGCAVGYLFPRSPVLKAYSADLAGSLLGVLALTAVTFFSAPPPVWLALGALPFAWLSGRVLSVLSLIGIVVFGAYSIQGAVFSPYNRIDLVREGDSIRLSVNRDFHQYMHDLSDAALAPDGEENPNLDRLASYRRAYDLPFVINDKRGRALIVGAGTGNDVQAALRNGYEEVYSCDIDGEIIGLGRDLHPEKPYSDPRVTPVVNDARAYFEQFRGDPFDLICYGLLDSHAMFGQMSTLRLDNYVYTEEGIRAAWRHVAEDGHLTISFSIFGGPWIADRLYWTIAKATGREPSMFETGMHYGRSFIVARDAATLHLDRLSDFPALSVSSGETEVRSASDDWPFLYIRPGEFPWGYILVLGSVLLTAFISIPLAFGRTSMGRDFDPVLFLMGTGFLLIETRGITSLSLLFGSTWMVNSAIFAGVLVLVLVANLAVERFKFRRILPWFLGLIPAVLLIWAVNPSALNVLPLLPRGIVGGLITGLPVGFAGIIVSMLLVRSVNPTASLGSNLLGAVFGGCLEYLSMLFGLRALALLAVAIYLGALLLCFRPRPPA